jgi:hypothetical protein
LLVQAATALLLCEVAVRVLTTTNPDNGMAMIGRYALVPYRPAAEVVRASLARPGSYLVRDAELGWTVRPHGRSPDATFQASADAPPWRVP